MLRKFITIISLISTFFISTFFINNSFAEEKMTNNTSNPAKEVAIFAMGCFWCGAASFKDHDTHQRLPGILSIKSGYAGGTTPNPTYENHSGYKEAVKVEFDPNIVSYDKVLEIFWNNVNPFDDKGQFCDKGFPYTSAIFYFDEQQKKKADDSKTYIAKHFKKPVSTELIAATTFYDAEEYHQDYEVKNPIAYKFYRWNCGRDKRLQEVWGAWKYQHK